MTDNPHLTSAHSPPVLPTITTAYGSAMTVSHVGSISTPNLSVSNVFCVPKLHLNLISIGQLIELGLNLFFSSRGCLVQDSRTGQIVGTARKVGRLFELKSPSLSFFISLRTCYCYFCLHRVVSLSSRALTNAASTPVSFWGEAALTAVYIINRYSSPIVQNTTPYERLFDTIPNYSLLKVFGCVCFVLLQPHERTKLQPRSQLCCFLGYGLEEKGYRCYDPVAKRLRVSRHVVFWEHKMFYSLPSFSTGNFDSQADPLPDPFPEIPSPFVESVNSISEESPLADPTSYESPTADPTFGESPLSAPAVNPVNTTAPEPRRSHRVYKIKTQSDGTIDPYKARLIANGFTQEYGIDYEETFALVARLSSVRTLIALPHGFSHPPGFSHKVCRLRRALYGFKQAPRAWFAKFSSTISQHGFSASSYDSALFFRRSNHGIIPSFVDTRTETSFSSRERLGSNAPVHWTQAAPFDLCVPYLP
uniref:Reverse transcriptase Ty1/copia-type domain-containing protein n=1 Tax=Fagus sylvatica TaxID=28930 RepID=A0A2N9HAT1_FAGSY